MRCILFILLFSASVPALQAQISGSILHDGTLRTYELYIPSTWSAGQSLPLVFVLHGTTQTGSGIMNISEFNTIAEANGFIVAYPDGIGGSWNTGIPGASIADDLGLMDALASELTMQYGVDSTRVFSCGFSAGGYFSHRLACESPRCFAAIASVAGTMMPNVSTACTPNHATPVMQIHGTSDLIVAYNGGGIAGLGVEAVMTLWNAINNCPATPVITQLPNINLLDLSTVEQQVWSPCDMNTSNVLLKVIGGGHQWPGTSALLGGVGTINQDIDASQMVWDFFSSYSCPPLVTQVISTSPEQLDIHITATGVLVQWHGARTPYTVLNSIGQVVQFGELHLGMNEIDLSSMVAGAYILRSSDPSIAPALVIRP